ncbi:DUF3231 family protein [Bacillus suaedaesalsae]|uniref:DUF3231 family protein n=1 Tax=Bacillus suaedaesalsae TaxID=2810349 RepID=A0ABS2DHH8_9BACI|nr:DUF3231 family protein [Bacillus suaedaesalsae]
METDHHINLTSAEIAHLYTTFSSDSMAIRVLSYFLENTQDTEIKPILEQSLSISLKHLEQISKIFTDENYVIPIGFGEEDVNVQAPALFYDTFYIHYVKQMSRVGLNAYSLGLSIAARSDVRMFYHEALKDATELDENVTNVALQKGLYIRAPYIIGPKETEFVHTYDFLGELIGKPRPLLGMEIAHLYGNLQTISLGKALCIGFSQAARSKEVTKFFIKLRESAGKHMDMITDKINGSHLKPPLTWNDTVTESIFPPFSDKLMMFHINAVMATVVGDFGVSLGASLRKDINSMYGILITELELHLYEGAKLMIKNGWMEKPPQAMNRDELANLSDKTD